MALIGRGGGTALEMQTTAKFVSMTSPRFMTDAFFYSFVSFVLLALRRYAYSFCNRMTARSASIIIDFTQDY